MYVRTQVRESWAMQVCETLGVRFQSPCRRKLCVCRRLSPQHYSQHQLGNFVRFVWRFRRRNSRQHRLVKRTSKLLKSFDSSCKNEWKPNGQLRHSCLTSDRNWQSMLGPPIGWPFLFYLSPRDLSYFTDSLLHPLLHYAKV